MPGDQLPAFPVFCDMSADIVTNVVHHNLESRSRTPNMITAGLGQYVTYKLNVTYTNNGVDILVDQLAVMVDSFQDCLYHYIHECTENGLTDSDWVDRNGMVTNDWTGTSTMCHPSKYLSYSLNNYIVK